MTCGEAARGELADESSDRIVIDLALGDRVVPSLGREFVELLAEPHRQQAPRDAREVAASTTSSQPFAPVAHQVEAEPPVVVCQRGAIEAYLLTPSGDGEVMAIARGYRLERHVAELTSPGSPKESRVATAALGQSDRRAGAGDGEPVRGLVEQRWVEVVGRMAHLAATSEHGRRVLPVADPQVNCYVLAPPIGEL
jgi:hypothetical protein